MKTDNTRFRNAMMWLATVGLLLIVGGTLMPVVLHEQAAPAFKYVYTAGAVILVLARLFTPFGGNNIRLRRLHRMEGWSGIFFCVGAFFLFYNPTTLRDWLAFTLAGGCIQAYASIMIPREARKEVI